MKRILFFVVGIFWLSQQVFATHNRAGEITYRQVSEFTYEFTVVTYTYSKAIADRDSLEVSWGDNTTSWVKRNSKTELPDDFRQNIYFAKHTFPGPSTYSIVMLDQNRNAGVSNIEGSVNIPFAIKTTLRINPNLGFNSTPILLTKPLDKAGVGKLFIHNPAAYDLDGDSLSYKLTVCLGDNGEPIPGYVFPQSSNRPIYINAVTGDLVWDSPTKPGVFNIAILIEEWRNGVKIGQILRDMQILVEMVDNNAPVIQPISDVCIEAGKKLDFDVAAEDLEGDKVLLTAYGGPMELPSSNATFNVMSTVPYKVLGHFSWQTLCEHVRKRPYQMEFKAEDQNRDTKLVSFQTANITVISPAPVIKDVSATVESLAITWNATNCTHKGLLGYAIYRKIGMSDFVPDNCQTGIPSGTGFKQIAYVTDLAANAYLDQDPDLKQGHVYCYRIVAVYADGSQSYASNEMCENLIQGIPVLTNVDVLNTNQNTGAIYVAWVKPSEHDTQKYPGPYSYKLYRATGINGTDFKFLETLNGIDNVEYTDKNVNTADTSYRYKVEFYSGTQLVSPPQTASSVFINLASKNNMQVLINRNVPWIDTTYVVWRKGPTDNDFIPIGNTHSLFYSDASAILGNEYCYKVEAQGYYTVAGIKSPITNHSEEECGRFEDKIPPCPPVLGVESKCDISQNFVSWTNTIVLDCGDDIASYQIFYAPNMNHPTEQIANIQDPAQLSYIHAPEGGLAGCYQVQATDKVGNLSEKSVRVCIDNCSLYNLPNIFTPNEDGVNDLYHPVLPYYNIEKVDFKVFNRWGFPLFQTQNPSLDWDGTDSTTGKVVSSGTYFYTCTVYERRLTGVEDRHLSGFIQVQTYKKGETKE